MSQIQKEVEITTETLVPPALVEQSTVYVQANASANVGVSATIEEKRVEAMAVIGQTAEILKQGAANIAESTMATVHQTQASIGHVAREGVDWAKEVIQENVDIVKEKTQEVVQKAQDGAQLVGAKMGLTTDNTAGNFDQKIAVGAAIIGPDSKTLQQLDGKTQLDARIETVQHVPFDTAIQREASEKHAAHVIEARKEDLNVKIDAGAEKLKQGVAAATVNTVSTVQSVKENLDRAQDQTQLGVNILKDSALHQTEVVKENIQQNVNWVKANVEEGIEKVVEVARTAQANVQEQTQLLAERVGLVPPTNFDTAIERKAYEVQRSLDMDNLRELDAKNQLDAKIGTVQHTDFDTEIARGATKIQTIHQIDSNKEAALGAIDRTADTLRSAVESVAEGTKSLAINAQANVNMASDAVKLNVDLVKEGAQKNVELLKEKAKENLEYAKANIEEGKEMLMGAVQRTQEAVVGLGEQIKSIPQGTFGVTGDFNKEIAIESTKMKITRDNDKLAELDAKHQLDAEIHTVIHTDQKTELERKAATMAAVHQVEAVRDNLASAIDTAAHKLKEGVEIVADNTKVAAVQTQRNVYAASDKVQLAVDLSKDQAHHTAELVKEKARENTQWVKANVQDGSEKLIAAGGISTYSQPSATPHTAPLPHPSAAKEELNREIVHAADDMHGRIDMGTLQHLDEKHQLNAEVKSANTDNTQSATVNVHVKL